MPFDMSLTDLATELQSRSERKKDVIVNTEELRMNFDGSLHMNENEGGLGFMEPNDVAHQQIANRTGIPIRYYREMKKSSGELLARNVNHWFQAKPENRMIRMIDHTARAFLSDKFKRIENEEIADMVLPILAERPDTQIKSCNITDTKMYIKAVFTSIQAEVKVGDVIESGVIISNSEVGMGSVSILPFLHRLICLNGMHVNDMGHRARHLGSRKEIKDGVFDVLTDETKSADDRATLLMCRDVVRSLTNEEILHTNIRKMQIAAEDTLEGNVVEAVKVLSKKESLNDFEQDSVLRHLIEGGDLSRYGMLNAVTRTAQDVEDYDRATELEGIGGKILNYTNNEYKPVRLAA